MPPGVTLHVVCLVLSTPPSWNRTTVGAHCVSCYRQMITVLAGTVWLSLRKALSVESLHLSASRKEQEWKKKKWKGMTLFNDSPGTRIRSNVLVEQ